MRDAYRDAYEGHEEREDGREGEPEAYERVFAAPPPPRGRGFATTWWGQRWLKALEDTALDTQRLRQGRRHARAGAVGAVSVRPGRLTAVVRAGDGTAHRADVLLRRLTAPEWERLLDTIAREAGHLAALLDRDLPPALADDAEAAGVELLPGIGDLEPTCDCGEWDHCAHTAALSYQVARLLDADPFVILLLRGRPEPELLAELQRRNAAQAPARERAPERGVREPERAGVPAAEAYARPPAPLPPPPPPVGEPGTPPALGGVAAPGPGLDVPALEFLARAAAVRARRLLAEALAPPAPTPAPAPAGPAAGTAWAPLGRWQDAARLAALAPPARILGRLAEGCGRTPRDLDMAVRAWEFGGPAALAVLEDATLAVPARAVARLATAWEEEARPVLRGAGNRWTAVGTGAQLRCGPDGRWWPYRREGGRWWPAGPAEADPAAALAAALAAVQASASSTA
ncbi:SWIM zinc finger family protein [Streptomyces sp. 6N223]|uniref:SWIM zinc finger family protein n=1 Tax=Streptomyces sp. 6N223 TaxID=3457412 RepID=UPI003FCF7BD8